MSNSVYRSVGQMGKLLIAREDDYGTPGKDFHYFGNAISLKASNSANYESLPPTCSRNRGEAYVTRRTYGFSASSKFTDEESFKRDFPYVIDGKPITMFIMAAHDEYHGYTGSVLEQMIIKSPKIGSALEFDMSFVSQYLSISEERKGWSALGVQFSPDPFNCYNGKVLTDAGNPVATIKGVEEEIPFDNWQISIGNNTQPVAGYVGDYALNAGAGNLMGVMDIEATITQQSMSNKWNIRKWLTEDIEQLVFPLRAGNNLYSIKLKDMYYVGDTMAEHSAENPYTEDIKVNARTIEIL